MYQCSFSRKPKRRKIVKGVSNDELRKDSSKKIFILGGGQNSSKGEGCDDLARFQTDQSQTQGSAGKKYWTAIHNLLIG